MKKLHACPKCQGRKIWMIEPWNIPGDLPEGRALPLIPHQPEVTTSFFQVERVTPKGQVDLWVCHDCGYAELWAKGTADLVEDPAKGIRLLDSSATKAGPFR